MELKCKNCNQFISEDDKFCKFCACPNEAFEIKQEALEKESQKGSKRTIRAIEDEIQFKKSHITQEDAQVGALFDIANLSLLRKGERGSLYARSVVALIVAVLGVIASVIFYYVLQVQKNWNLTLRFVLMWVICVAILAFVTLITSKALNISELGRVKEGDFVTRKFSFAKTPQVLIAGTVFDVKIINNDCPVCDGEIKGNLHLENIYGNYCAVCNYDRRHFWTVPVAEFLSQFVAIGHEEVGDIKELKLEVAQEKDTIVINSVTDTVVGISQGKADPLRATKPDNGNNDDSGAKV